MPKWKVYISSTFKDLKEYRSELKALFEKELSNNFELCKIMELMFDEGDYTLFVKDCKEAVKSCDIYIIILGNRVGSYPPNETRTYTEIELDTAIENDKKLLFFRLETFDEHEIDNKEKHQEILMKFEGRNVHPFKNIQEFENEILKHLFQFAHLPCVNKDNPYKGLAAFTIEDGANFYGRNQEIKDCLQKISLSKGNAIISIIGNSGIGKTSFVQAGVLFSLQNIKALGFSNYKQIIVTPGSEPYSNFIYQLKESGIELGEGVDIIVALDKTILFFNQFEEVITQCNTPESVLEREQLFDCLDSISSQENTQSKFIILTTFRSDFLSLLANFDFIKKHQILPLSSLNYTFHPKNWEESIKQIILQPALNHGVQIEEALVKLLIEQIKEVDGSLPILQFTLHQLWNRESIKDRIITSTEYNKLSQGKGLAGIIETHAENVVKKITENGTDSAKEIILKSIMVNLVEVNENSLDIKKTVKKDELLKKLKVYATETVNEVFEYLVNENSRLLVVSQAKDNSINVDIIHEVLIRKWERLRTWINERREALEYGKKISSDIDDELYTGKKLEQAMDWKTQNPDLNNQEIDEFIEKSINEKEKKREAIQKRIKISMGAIFVLGLLVWGLYNPYQKWLFEKEINKIPSLREQIEASGGDIDSVKTLIINESNYLTAKRKLFYFKHVDTLKIENCEYIKDLSLLKGLTSLESLVIRHNDNLKSLTGVEQLKLLNHLETFQNFSLKTLQGIEQLKSLKSLQVSHEYSLNNLEPIQYLDSLTHLEIPFNGNIKNLQGIGQHKLLTYLAIYNLGNRRDSNGIEQFPNLAGIERLESLTSLVIPNNVNLKGVELLKSLNHLEILINDGIIHLKGMNNLKSILSLKINNLNYSPGFKGLEEFESLISLDIVGRVDLNGIEKLKSLSYLLISNNDIVDLNFIASTKSLTHLEIKTNSSLNNLKGIEKLETLHSLIISNTSLSSLQGLENLTTLDSLEIFNNNNLVSLQELENLTTLKSLVIYNVNQQNSLQGLENLTTLKSLVIYSNNNQNNLNWLENFKDIKSLAISDNNNLDNLQGIEKLKTLHSLEIGYNKNLNSLSGIEQLPNLRILTIRLLPESSSKILYELTNLEKLYIPRRIEIDYKRLTTKNPGLKLIRI